MESLSQRIPHFFAALQGSDVDFHSENALNSYLVQVSIIYRVNSVFREYIRLLPEIHEQPLFEHLSTHLIQLIAPLCEQYKE